MIRSKELQDQIRIAQEQKQHIALNCFICKKKFILSSEMRESLVQAVLYNKVQSCLGMVMDLQFLAPGESILLSKKMFSTEMTVDSIMGFSCSKCTQRAKEKVETK